MPGEPEMATVNGKPITQRELRRGAARTSWTSFARRLGAQFDPALMDTPGHAASACWTS